MGERTGGRGRTGVTMVEVLTVVIVLGLLAGLVVPRFFAAQGRSQVDGDAQTLFQDLLWMRTETVKTRKRHYLVLDPVLSQWRIYREEGGNLVCDPGTGDSLVRTHDLAKTVVFGFHPGFSPLPGALSATTGFASVAVPTSGLGAGAATDDCLEGAASGPGSWDASVTACVSRGVPDLETGVVYLTTTRSTATAAAILYNDRGAQASLQVQRWVWNGSWSRS